MIPPMATTGKGEAVFTSPIGYTYEADHHCRQCAGNRFGTDWLTGFVLDSARDREGNPVGAVFSWDEWFEPSMAEVQTLTCGTCMREIDRYEPLDEIEQAAIEIGRASCRERV